MLAKGLLSFLINSKTNGWINSKKHLLRLKGNPRILITIIIIILVGLKVKITILVDLNAPAGGLLVRPPQAAALPDHDILTAGHTIMPDLDSAQHLGDQLELLGGQHRAEVQLFQGQVLERQQLGQRGEQVF